MDSDVALPYSLHTAATLQDLERIREFVRDTVLAIGVATGSIDMIVLAVDEAVSNVIIHGYGRKGGPIELDMGRAGDRLIVRLRDAAPPFDPTQVVSPDVTVSLFEREPGGLGIHLIRRIMDEMLYRARPGGGNELILTKR